MIPVYNEAACIEKVVNDWLGALRFQKLNFKIILVNDGSTDNTKEIIESLSKTIPELVLINQVNGGHGNALITGYSAALTFSSNFIFQVDSDDQFLPSDFSKLWILRESSPFVIGVRTQRNDPRIRLLISSFLRKILSLAFKANLKDANIPFRLIKSDLIKAILHCLPSNSFAPNIFIAVLAQRHLGLIPQVPVNHLERETGEVSIIRLGLLKACTRSFIEIFKFSSVLDYKLSQLELELGQSDTEPKKRYA